MASPFSPVGEWGLFLQRAEQRRRRKRSYDRARPRTYRRRTRKEAKKQKRRMREVDAELRARRAAETPRFCRACERIHAPGRGRLCDDERVVLAH